MLDFASWFEFVTEMSKKLMDLVSVRTAYSRRKAVL